MLRVLLTGGGSGGHVYPAIAIADTIRMNVPDAKIAFVGTREGKETDLVPRAGYPLYFIESKGIRRSLSLSNIQALLLALTSPYSKKTTGILKEFQPDIVIGTGGYVCWPLLKAASRAGIPTMVHESNCMPGLAVRQLQRDVDTILLNFEESASYLKQKQKCTVVGNPLRGGFGAISREVAREKVGIAPDETFVLCYAGSLGSSTVNAAVLRAVSELIDRYPKARFLLSSGTRNYEAARAQLEAYGLQSNPRVSLQPYIYNMADQMAAADVVISRAGAMSLSELSRMGKASIIVPSPYVADNHQLHNAQAMAEREAAILVEEKDFDTGALTQAVEQMISQPSRRALLQANIRSFAPEDANRLIYDLILQAVNGKSK